LGRADRCRRLAGLAGFGRGEGARQTFDGVRAHLGVCWPGVLGDGHLAPANLQDLALADDLLADAHGWVLGTVPTGARPEPNGWPTTVCGCWRRHDRPGGRGHACPTG
jgi:hypothetical protein